MNALSLPFSLLDVGGPELFLILFIILILFGSKRLPELARGFGKAMREFKKATNGVEEDIRQAMEDPPPRPKPKAPAALKASPETKPESQEDTTG